MPPDALLASVPPPSLAARLIEDGPSVLWIAGLLGLAAGFATLRAALRRAHAERVLELGRSSRRSHRTAELIERGDSLSTSAAILRITCEVLSVILLVGLVAGDRGFEWHHLAITLAIAAPVLFLSTEALPNAVARTLGDRILMAVLPAFHLLQLPLGGFVALVHGLHRLILRALGLREDSPSERRIVAELRGMIEGSGEGVLDATEREILENVMEFGDVDVAAVMTPRTEIRGVSADSDLKAALGVIAESGHSRIPVYRDSVDAILGTVTALEMVKAMAEDRLEATRLQEVLRPAFFVPETKRISELLAEFRHHKQKMAIVLDEYGGTAGIVTLGDITAELVGDVPDEHEEKIESMRVLEGGTVEVLAGLHVSDVNEALGLDIPEEQDFETLGGFVLAELGHFPKQGESFTRSRVRYRVVEASDRRILKVAVQRSA